MSLIKILSKHGITYNRKLPKYILINWIVIILNLKTNLLRNDILLWLYNNNFFTNIDRNFFANIDESYFAGKLFNINNTDSHTYALLAKSIYSCLKIKNELNLSLEKINNEKYQEIMINYYNSFDNINKIFKQMFGSQYLPHLTMLYKQIKLD